MSMWFSAISFFPELSMGLHLQLNRIPRTHAHTDFADDRIRWATYR
jgi:hypothetical protein